MSMREEFEEAMLEMEHPHFGFLGNEYLAKEGEEYLDVYMQGLWIGWKASRAALVVESCHTHPELILTDEDRAYEQGVQNQLSKIKAAGVQVKP